jgi:hypothetical protein
VISVFWQNIVDGSKRSLMSNSGELFVVRALARGVKIEDLAGQ